MNVRFAPDGKLYVADVDDDHLTVLSASGKVVAHVGHGIKGPNGLAFGVCPQAARRR